MYRINHLAAAILAAAFSMTANATMVCEYEPTKDLRDCSKCFKADADGVKLFLGGKLRASSTSHVLFPSTPIDGLVYQRGDERKIVSGRVAGNRMYEVCYEKAAPMQASNFVFSMDATDLEEFEMGDPSGAPDTHFNYVLTNKPAGARVAFFGTKLVVMPLPGWSGRLELSYQIVDGAGQRSSPGKIRITGDQVTEQQIIASLQADPEAAALARKAAEDAANFRRLEEELRIVEEALQAENEVRDRYLMVVVALESQLVLLQQRLEETEHEMATLIHAKERAHERYLQRIMAMNIAEQKVRDGYTHYSVLDQLKLPELAEGRYGSTPGRLPVPSHTAQVVMTRRLSVRRAVFGELSLVGDAPSRKAPALRQITRNKPPRRLSKKVKKQLKKQRRQVSTSAKRSRRNRVESSDLPSKIGAVAC